MSERTPVLTKEDLNRCGRRWCTMAVGTFNYETQLATSVVYAEAKALRKIYPNDEDYKKSLNNQFKYFNTMPYIANFVLAAGLAMEDQDGLDAMDAVQNMKVSLMGPLAGIGDSIGWILLPTIFGSISAYMGQQGNPAGLIIWTIAYLLLWFWRTTWWNYGYKIGASFFSGMSSQISAFTEAASILGLTVVGAMIPTTVVLRTGLSFQYGDVVLGVQEGILDAILPYLLPVLATLAVYKLLNKGVKMTHIILGILVLGCIGAATGILV